MTTGMAPSVSPEQLNKAGRDIQNHYLRLRINSEETVTRFEKGVCGNSEDVARAKCDIVDFKGLHSVLLELSNATSDNWPDAKRINELRKSFDLPDSLKNPDGTSPAREDAYRLSMEILRAFEARDIRTLSTIILEKRERIITSEDAATLKRTREGAERVLVDSHDCATGSAWENLTVRFPHKRPLETPPATITSPSLVQPSQIAAFVRNFLTTLDSENVILQKEGLSFIDSNSRHYRIFDIEKVHGSGFGAASDIKFKASISGTNGMLTISSAPSMVDGTFRTKADGSIERNETVEFKGARERTKQRYLGLLSNALIHYESSVFELRIPDAEKLFKTTRAKFQAEVKGIFEGLESLGKESMKERRQIGDGPGALATHHYLEMRKFDNSLAPTPAIPSTGYYFSHTTFPLRQEEETRRFFIARQTEANGTFNYVATLYLENPERTLSGVPALRIIHKEITSIRAAFGTDSPFK